MGCGNCGTGTSGKPSGCKSNGGCSSGGCNRLNVFNWLSALPLHDSAKPYAIIEVSFNKGSRKDYFRNNTHNILEKGQWITVEGMSGFDVGQVSLTGELVKLQLKKYGVEEAAIKRVLRMATEEDCKIYDIQKQREPEILIRSRAISRSLNLDMKLCEIEMQADGKKATFFYTADQRVDFRELIRVYANEFRVKVEMRQIGARQESGKVGGIGSCGRELCCSTWLSDFKSVNTTAARYQNLAINQTKLSGQCGRLKCCLNYELDTYMDALKVFPENAEVIETTKGNAQLQKRDIFKNLMWYSYSDSHKQYPLSIVRVKEILDLNKKGQKADELRPVELEVATDAKTGIKVDMGFVNDVGQLSLKSLEKQSKKKRKGPERSHQGDRSQQQALGPNQQRNSQQGNRRQEQGNRQQGQPRSGQAQRTPDRQGGASGERPAQQQAQQRQGQPNQQQRQNQAPRQNQPRPNNPNRDRNQGNRPPRPEGDKPAESNEG